MKNLIEYLEKKDEPDVYICLENNKTYKNPRTITNLLFHNYNMTALDYCIKWDLVNKKDYLECNICGKYCDGIGKHLSVKHKEYGGVEQYKKDYGEDVKLVCDKYKAFLTNKMTGKNNHNHKDNTTLLERQQKSPFSIEFWKLKYPNKNDKDLKDILSVFIDSALSGREFDTRLDYYIKRGYTEEEGLELIKKRQTTFSLEICIEKYGENDGFAVWKKRQEKWLETLDSKTDEEKLEIKKKKLNGSGYSKISQELFWSIYDNHNHNFNIKFKELNNEVILYDNKSKNVFAYDYIDFDNKKVIEFNGDFWHCNPTIYKEDYIHRLTNKKAKDVWEFDKIKNNFIESLGYDLLIVWESDYKKNKKIVIDKCLEFIYND